MPLATDSINSKISAPSSSIVASPDSRRPQSRSMSSSIFRASALFDDILIVGVGFDPNTDPRPVVKTIKARSTRNLAGGRAGS